MTMESFNHYESDFDDLIKFQPLPSDSDVDPDPDHMQQNPLLTALDVSVPEEQQEEFGSQISKSDDKVEHLCVSANDSANANDSLKFQCDICQKSSKTKRLLKAHLLTHSDSSFVCDICQKSFKTFSYLQRHQNVTHSDVRNYVCSVCEKKFKLNSHLKVHMYQHTREHVSTCPHCDNKKEYVTALALKLHVQRCHRNLVMENAQKNAVVEGQGQGQGQVVPQPLPLGLGRQLPIILQRRKRN